MIDPAFWNGKKVFVTGHTGFKGSWLCMWLHSLGAEVFGYALQPPSDPSLYELANVDELVTSTIDDVRDLAALERALANCQPDIVIHMAAQTLVRFAYDHPVETFSTNVLGAVHVLDAVRRVPSVRAVVVVTSDKCYYNEEWVWGYREDSRLGGHDPYSSSKGCAELVTTAYQHSFFGADRPDSAAVIGSARAGNVIGGGDWALDRLVPDIIRSLLDGKPTLIRNPQATRPWQHVLEPLHGYLMLAERLFDVGHDFASGWNFGPPEESERTVGWVIAQLYDLWESSSTGFATSTSARPRARSSSSMPPRPELTSAGARSSISEQRSSGSSIGLGRTSGENVRDVSLADIHRFMAISPPA